MALHTDTEIYKATYALTQLTTQLVANMPRNYKADFGADLRKRCMALVMRTYQANTTEDKPQILQRMLDAADRGTPYSIDADPLGIRAHVADAIAGALALGAQGSGNPPPDHWLAPFWHVARVEAGLTQKDARDAALGRVAIGFVDRAGDVHPGIDDADTICAEFHVAMSQELVKWLPAGMLEAARAAQGGAA